jgi:adenosylcobinamide kinase / adenosylcobinamide-phosphate guanylyltransferase
MTYLITGGVRSGKSSYAEALAKYFADEVLYIATLEPSDEEMKRRIAKHKSQRPENWRTLEVKPSYNLRKK